MQSSSASEIYRLPKLLTSTVLGTEGRIAPLEFIALLIGTVQGVWGAGLVKGIIRSMPATMSETGPLAARCLALSVVSRRRAGRCF